MPKDEALKATIMRLCDAVRAETNPRRLTQLLIELNQALDALHAPRESKFKDQAMMMYTPTTEDVEWARAAISMLKEDGVLAYPQTKLHYRLDRAHKTLTLMNPDQLFDRDSFVTHVQTVAVFSKIGYIVNEWEEA
jgi:hypothetical protein